MANQFDGYKELFDDKDTAFPKSFDLGSVQKENKVLDLLLILSSHRGYRQSPTIPTTTIDLETPLNKNPEDIIDLLPTIEPLRDMKRRLSDKEIEQVRAFIQDLNPKNINFSDGILSNTEPDHQEVGRLTDDEVTKLSNYILEYLKFKQGKSSFPSNNTSGES